MDEHTQQSAVAPGATEITVAPVAAPPPHDVVAAPRRRRLTSIPTLAAFEIPAFRWLWLNSFSFMLIGSTQRFAYVWLVLELGGRAGASGLVSFALGFPVLFIALPAGVLADRVDRRMLMAVSQIGALVVTALTAVLIWTDAMTIPLTFALSVALGTTTAIGAPVRSAIVPSVVPPDKLMNAIVLQGFVMNVTMIIGPAIGGAIIAAWGLGGAMAASAVTYLVGILFLVPLRVPRVVRMPGRSGSIREGFAFVLGHRGIAILLGLLTLSSFAMMGPFSALLPVLARTQLGRDAFEASLLFTSLGAGMLVASLLLASIKNMRRRGAWFIGTMIPGGVIWAGIGLSRSYVLTVALMFAWGIGGGFFMNLNQTLIQSNTPQEYMGRVMSVHTLIFMGISPIGALIAGAGADAIGAPVWIAAGGLLQAAVAIFTLATRPELRRMG